MNKTEKVNQELNDLVEKRREAIKQLPQYRGEVQSKNQIRQLPEVAVGEIFWADMDGCAYIVADKDGHKLTIKALDENASISTGISVFELNKQLVEKEPIIELTEENVNTLKSELKRWFNNAVLSNKYFLMYGREIHYVTLFKHSGKEVAIDSILETILEVGDLISIDYNTEGDEQSVVEIWMRTKEEKATLLYIIPYDRGIVYC